VSDIGPSWASCCRNYTMTSDWRLAKSRQFYLIIWWKNNSFCKGTIRKSKKNCTGPPTLTIVSMEWEGRVYAGNTTYTAYKTTDIKKKTKNVQVLLGTSIWKCSVCVVGEFQSSIIDKIQPNATISRTTLVYPSIITFFQIISRNNSRIYWRFWHSLRRQETNQFLSFANCFKGMRKNATLINPHEMNTKNQQTNEDFNM